MREAARRDDDLNLTENEIAFYDAIETSDLAVAVMDGKSSLRSPRTHATHPKLSHHLLDRSRERPCPDPGKGKPISDEVRLPAQQARARRRDRTK